MTQNLLDRNEEIKNFVGTANCLLYYDKYEDKYDYMCSKCLHSVYTSYVDDELKFCPYCGAKYEKIERKY